MSAELRIRAAYVIAERVIPALEDPLADLRNWTFSEEELAGLGSPEKKDLDAFLKRFENGVEAGRRLFRATLMQGREEQRGLSAGEVATRMEQLGLLDSADRWAAIVAARNAATHDYAVDLEDLAEALPRAYTAAAEVLGVVRTLLSRLRHRFPPDEAGGFGTAQS